MQAGVHAHYVLVCLGSYLSQTGLDQRDQSIYGIRRACQTCLSTWFYLSMQACLHACYLLVSIGQYLAKLGCITEIKASIESGKYAGPVRAHSLTWQCKVACMHTMCLCAQAKILANLGPIGNIDVYRIGGTNQSWLWCQSTCMHLSMHTLFSCMHRPICN